MENRAILRHLADISLSQLDPLGNLSNDETSANCQNRGSQKWPQKKIKHAPFGSDHFVRTSEGSEPNGRYGIQLAD